MKQFLLLIFILISSEKALSQDFQIDSIYKKYKGTDTSVYVYMTALWCSPCLEKMPYIDAFFSNTTMPYKIIYLFDIEKFSWKTLSKIFPHIDFTDKISFIPKKYYSKSSIQINAHNRMFKNFIDEHSLYKPRIHNINTFTLSSIIALPSLSDPYVFELPKLNGESMQSMDSLFRIRKI
jgi:thiol-disulfide isomerase/thioredoxin